jgi:Fanconi anemia group M protein
MELNRDAVDYWMTGEEPKKEISGKKGKPEKPEKTITILIDSREDGAVFSAFRTVASNPDILKTLKLDRIIIQQKNNMESGDFVCGEYAIEHKSPDDYRASTFNRHLDEQIQTMKATFKDFAIAFSGECKDIFYDKIGRGSFASYLVKDAPVLICGDLETMAEICIKALYKWNDGKDRTVDVNVNHKKYEDPQLNVITGIPSISEEKGKALLDKFKSLEGVFNASVEELQEIDGIGKKIAQNIYSTLHAPRW